MFDGKILALVSGEHIWGCKWMPEKTGWKYQGGRSVCQQGAISFILFLTVLLKIHCLTSSGQIPYHKWWKCCEPMSRGSGQVSGRCRSPCGAPAIGGIPNLPGEISWIRFCYNKINKMCVTLTTFDRIFPRGSNGWDGPVDSGRSKLWIFRRPNHPPRQQFVRPQKVDSSNLQNLENLEFPSHSNLQLSGSFPKRFIEPDFPILLLRQFTTVQKLVFIMDIPLTFSSSSWHM